MSPIINRNDKEMLKNKNCFYIRSTSSSPIWIIPVLILLVWGTSLFANMQSAAALPLAEARHLLARTGFGLPRPDEIMALAHMSRDQAVDNLLRGLILKPTAEPPAWVGDPMPHWNVRKIAVELCGSTQNVSTTTAYLPWLHATRASSPRRCPGARRRFPSRLYLVVV